MRCKVMASQLATINSRMSDAINPRRKILVLRFQLEATDGKIVELIAWLEPDGKPTRPGSLVQVTQCLQPAVRAS